MFFKGKIIYLKKGVYASLLWPLIFINKTARSIYNYLLEVIWSELIKGEKIDNELYSLFLFIIFVCLSVLIYRFKSTFNLIFWIFLIIYCLDYWLTKYYYLSQENQDDIIICQAHSQLILYQKNKQKTRNKLYLIPEEFKKITIKNTNVTGGAFDELLETTWQIEIALADDYNCLVHETKQVWDAFQKAKYLANRFNLPLIFTNSEGQGKYADQSLETNSVILPSLSPTIQFKKNSQQYHIYSQWRWNNSWYLLKQIFAESGFLIFLIIMSDFIVRFGGLMDSIINIYINNSSKAIYLPSIWEWFQPELGLKDILKFALVIGILIIKGAQLSRNKHIYLDKNYLKFFIDNQKIAQVKTSKIETVLFIKQPQPKILILAQNQAITIKNFQREEEFRAWIFKLSEAIGEITLIK